MTAVNTKFIFLLQLSHSISNLLELQRQDMMLSSPKPMELCKIHSQFKLMCALDLPILITPTDTICFHHAFMMSLPKQCLHPALHRNLAHKMSEVTRWPKCPHSSRPSYPDQATHRSCQGRQSHLRTLQA